MKNLLGSSAVPLNAFEIVPNTHTHMKISAADDEDDDVIVENFSMTLLFGAGSGLPAAS